MGSWDCLARRSRAWCWDGGASLMTHGRRFFRNTLLPPASGGYDGLNTSSPRFAWVEKWRDGGSRQITNGRRTRVKRAAVAAVALMTVLGWVFSSWLMAPAEAQDTSDDRLAALETQVADQEDSIANLQGRIKTLEGAVQPTEEDTESDAQPTAEQEEDDAGDGDTGSFGNPVPLGDEADIGGDWTLKVVDVVPDATDQVMAENQFNEPPAEGRQFFVVTVALTNNSEKPASPSSVVGFSAVGASAVAYESSEDRYGVIPGELPSSEIFPGGTTEGALCWSVRPDDVESLVMYTDSYVTFDEEDRVYFALR